jgi:hypothetical protein
MKIYLSILCFLLLSCCNYKGKPTSNIVTKKIFETTLKEIHLAKAIFEINKNTNIKNAKNELNNKYFEIYKKNQLSQNDFKETLNYYSENPEKLKRTYNNILEVLMKEDSINDQRETN